MIPKTTDLCDACADILACSAQFLSFGLRRSFAGDIRTIRCFENIDIIRKVVNQPGNNQVLVIDAGGSLSRALFGDIMANIACRNGWSGLVVNGAIRDSLEINNMDFGVKALGTVPRRIENGGSGTIDEPVTFGGITFTPGHRLVADPDGVIVLPAGLQEADIALDDVLAATAAYSVAQ